MKNFLYLFIFLCFPTIISAQQKQSLRNPIDNCIYRDSALNMFRPVAEKWRLAYNNQKINQLSEFYSNSSKNRPLNLIGYFEDVPADFIAVFQNKNEKAGSIDSLLILSINPSCDLASLFVMNIGLAESQNLGIQNIYVWEKNNKTWSIKSHISALKED